MQWQHGGWVKNADGSLKLTPIAVDGRQLLSAPCNGKNAVYTRYNQTETIQVGLISISGVDIVNHMLTEYFHRNTSNSSILTTTSRASTCTSSTARL